MAIQWIEGFESFESSNGNSPVGLMQKYDYGIADSNFTVQAGRIQGKSMRFTSASSVIGRIFSAAGVSTMILGFGFYVDSIPSAPLLQVFDFIDTVGAGRQGALELQADGTWKYMKGGTIAGGGGSSLGQSSGHAITTGTWFYVELKVKFHGSTGTVDIWVDGSNVLSLTSQNTSQTGNTFVNMFRLFGSGVGATHATIDDIYILDDTTSFNNARLGPQVVTLLVPTADTGTNQFTTDSGSNHYDRLSEKPRDTTSYVEDDVSTHRELFTMTTARSAAIAGIQMNTVAAVTGNTIRTIKNSIHTGGGTDSDDAGVTLADASYSTQSRIVQINPETSALWTQANLNASQFGFKLG